MRIGVTGHIGLTSCSRPLIRAALREALHEVRRRTGGRPLHGLTCLAEGADQLFAQEMLVAGATFDVVLPAPDYRWRGIRPARRRAFDALLEQARSVSYACEVSDDEAYAAAGRRVLDRCDLLFAVWDGSAGGIGGTAEVVAEARRRGVAVEVIWPPGAARLR
ncbi:hypothetical protein [Micromonospora sp. NBC_01813]|uniref:hypothetical protein n=1 Tax=Micromonospora sp. NBC_01813 TaxID=2975988 RepID=UPI002DDA47AA|nr:hypothetical protein [Micromonospora sp. NBC_01813]WSA09394.1 hypothetical protein OG958_00740 [Micromonospora sp. NBC_01813]